MVPALFQVYFELVGLQKRLHTNIQMVAGHEDLQAFGIIGLSLKLLCKLET